MYFFVTYRKPLNYYEMKLVENNGKKYKVESKDVGSGCTRVIVESETPDGISINMGVEADEQIHNFQSNIVYEAPFQNEIEGTFNENLQSFATALRNEDVSSDFWNKYQQGQIPPGTGKKLNFQLRTIQEDDTRRVNFTGDVGGIPLSISGVVRGKGQGARADIEITSPVMASIGKDGRFLGLVDYVRATSLRKGTRFLASVTKPDNTTVIDKFVADTLTSVCGMPVPLTFPQAGLIVGPKFDTSVAATVLNMREEMNNVAMMGFNANLIALAAARKCNNEIFEVFGASFSCILAVVAAGIALGATGGAATPAMVAAAVLCVGAQAGALIKELLVHAGII